MPRLDQTGPQGKGPNTGRGLGKCTGKVKSDSDNTDHLEVMGQGNRRRMRMGGRKGAGNRFRGGKDSD